MIVTASTTSRLCISEHIISLGSYFDDNCKGIHTGAWSVEVTDDVGHTSLVTHDSSQVDGFFGVILSQAKGSMHFLDEEIYTYLGERFNLSTVSSGSFSREES
jgi:hypothetical protein